VFDPAALAGAMNDDRRTKMSELQASKSRRAPETKTVVGRLFVLDASGNRIVTLNPDGSTARSLSPSVGFPTALR